MEDAELAFAFYGDPRVMRYRRWKNWCAVMPLTILELTQTHTTTFIVIHQAKSRFRQL
jgi:hypothetical protein